VGGTTEGRPNRVADNWIYLPGKPPNLRQ
jgi:hypothetical protein